MRSVRSVSLHPRARRLRHRRRRRQRHRRRRRRHRRRRLFMERRDYHAPVAKPLSIELGPAPSSPPLKSPRQMQIGLSPRSALWIALVLRANADCHHVLAARAQIRRRARDGRVVDFDLVLLDDARKHSPANEAAAALDRAGKRARRQLERDDVLGLEHERREVAEPRRGVDVEADEQVRHRN